MSIKDNTCLMTSEQVKRKLISIHIDKTGLKDRLLYFVEKFQCLDRVGESIGLIKENFSFANRVSWATIFEKLEALDSGDQTSEKVMLDDISKTVSLSFNQLENELIPKLQNLRNNWMLQVILVEFVVLSLASLVIAGVSHVLGFWSLSNLSFSVQPLLYERPIFSFLTLLVLLVSFVAFHFSIRRFVARQIVRKLNKENSDFDLVGAFLKSTGFIHSIFKPDIVGFGWLNRKRLLASQNLST